MRYTPMWGLSTCRRVDEIKKVARWGSITASCRLFTTGTWAVHSPTAGVAGGGHSLGPHGDGLGLTGGGGAPHLSYLYRTPSDDA